VVNETLQEEVHDQMVIRLPTVQGPHFWCTMCDLKRGAKADVNCSSVVICADSLDSLSCAELSILNTS
jgi:hypothetical protein